MKLQIPAKFAMIATCSILLSGCQSTGTHSPEANSVGSAAVEMPQDFKQKAAVHLVSEYLKDAIGPAEIQTEPQSRTALLGRASLVTVRYPVRTHSVGQMLIAKDWLLDKMEKTETGMRCITLAAVQDFGGNGETKLHISRPKNDGTSCGEGEAFAPYTELEQMAARLKVCQAKGEERCLLSTNMPEADARKLMNLR